MTSMTSLDTGTFSDLLGRIASKTPTPGGGAVAAATGALATSLAQMVVSYSLGKKSLASHQAELERADQSLRIARHLFLELGEEDAQAYGLVNELSRLPEGDRRRSELRGAVAASIQVPQAVIAACDDLLRLCEKLAPITNSQLRSDLAIAAVLAEAAARASRWNVAVNAAMLSDGDAKRRALADADRALADAAARRTVVERACEGQRAT
jgi:formiminotetrahydrofolate cyclodeaminase